MATLNQLEPTTKPAAADREPGGRRVHPLVWVLLAGAVVRGGLWMAWKDAPVRIVDAQDYNGLAVRLLETGSYVSESGKLISLRPPLYPAFVAGLYAIFGVENYAAVRAAQAILSLLTVVCVYLLGRELYSRRIGLLAAGGVCFYPSLLGFNNLLLSETLFTLFVTAITLTTVLAVRRESVGWLAATGLLLGLGALVRSILWLFAPFLSLFVFLVWPRREEIRNSKSEIRKNLEARNAKLENAPTSMIWTFGIRIWSFFRISDFEIRIFAQRAALAAVPLALFVLVLAPWAYRNTMLQKTFTLVDVMGGRNAMMGNYEHTPLERNWATISIVKGDKQWFRVLQKETPNYSELTQGQIDKVAMKHGIRFALAHPLLTAKRDLVRFFNFWQLERTLVAGAAQGIFGDVPKAVLVPAALLICGAYACVLFAGLFGAVFVPPAERRFHWLLAMTIVFPCVIHTLIFAHSRYHLPIIPVLMLYAAAAVANWRAIWEKRRSAKFRIVVAVCAVFVLAWLRELVFVDLGHMSEMVG
jgi:Dolichyl-phosphate-mannose-protein mannosyltransferase